MAVPLAVFECESPPAGDGEGEAVDPPGLVGAAVLLEPGAGELLDPVELVAVDRAERAAVPVGATGLDLAEDDGVGGAGDEVEFAEAVAPVAGEDLHAVALEVGGGEPFAEPAELVRAEPSQVHGVRQWRSLVALRGRCGDGGGRVHGRASARPGRGSRRTLPAPKRSIGSR
ncbi:hypothetical protein GALLR39Z86_21990 [Glycomyces algeriensis]|uniref:Uncharacterized protein n=1 Tax=Glycomyces algeriensis TaxID=256037 RepID=A0A9W6G725_9ACTN|nr:hypothetical protein GALLR39Z86_21990 [Glycomyces algeriensis]